MPRFPSIVVLALLAGPAAGADPRETLFRQRVVPIFERSCVGCHHGVAARARLSLETAASLARGGDSGPAINEHDPDASLLVQMISGEQPEMPREGPRLSADEVSVIRQWIESGAYWPADLVLQDKREGKPWWSLCRLQRPEVPRPIDGDAPPWIRNPIDAFVLERLRAQGLAPSPEADRITLIRRLTFDLHGLPPTPEEVGEFVRDDDPQAYEKLVDRLLASPRYGERWARHWLDVAHYGETHGYDKDKRRDHAWPYRDYVIRSFNEDKPYGRFVQEQICGDVLCPGDPQARIATGFIAAGPWDFVGHMELREGTVEKAKTRALDRDDMVANVMSTFTSMTVHCARCHDHAFDPIPQIDHYRLQAVFAGVDRQDVPYEDSEVVQQRRRLTDQRAALSAKLAEAEHRIERFEHPALTALDDQAREIEDQLGLLPEALSRLNGPPTSPSNGYHSEVSPEADAVKWVQVDLGRPRVIEAVRLIPARPTDCADRPGFGFPARFRIELADEASFSRPLIVADQTAADFPNPQANPYVVYVERASARYVRVTALKLWQRTGDYALALGELQVESGGENVALGAAVTALDSIEAGRWSKGHLVDGFDSRQPLPKLTGELTLALRQRFELEQALGQLRARRDAVLEAVLPDELRTAHDRLRGELSALDEQLAELAKPRLVYAVASHPPREIRLLERGNVEKPREVVGPGALSCLTDLPATFTLSDPNDEGARRAALADWITQPRNCLTWRSIVNRVWHYHFGRGIVETPNDFGRNGGLPTHPELLDWLAVEFRDGGQSLKQLHRLIVTSATYRQAVAVNDAAARIDAGNRYLWRANRRRLEAEELRDAILAISGKLDFRLGGPSFEPFAFKDDHSPRYDYVPMDKPELWRRSIYRLITRSVPNPWMEALDCPDPSLGTPVRSITITPLQALANLNDDFVVRQAAYFAQRLAGECSDARGQVERAFLLCFARGPKPNEREAALEYARRYGLDNLCRLLFNSNEFLFLD